MDPFRPLVIDNRAPAPVFLEGSPITDGMANLFASMINAPIAAGQVRRQRERDDREVAMQDQALARQGRQDQHQAVMQDQALARQAELDQRAVQWHNQEQATRGRDTGLQIARQNRQDAMEAEWRKAQIGNMQGDNARQMAAMFGNGLNNTAKRGVESLRALRGMFGGGAGGRRAASPTQARPEVRNLGTELDPKWRQWDGAAWMPLNMGEVAPSAAVAPGEVAAGAPADQGGSSFWTARRSGQPGVQTMGDVFGGFMDGWDPQAMERNGAAHYGINPAPTGDDYARPPGGEAAGIDMGGVKEWQRMAAKNPQGFKAAYRQLLAQGDPRAAILERIAQGGQ